ncbi:uncharacterized protein PODANS_5_9890, partial [Podospora anserina S mat+]
FLQGPKFGQLLKGLVDKGLFVTVVLDCCFSGSFYRDDDLEVRFVPFSHFATTKETGEGSVRDDIQPSTIIRDALMQDNWLLNPTGYSVMTASGPHEKAHEFEFPDGFHHGVLSYSLFKALQEYGGLGKRQRDMYSYVRAKVREYCSRQSPELYGSKHRSFFEHSASTTNMNTSEFVTITRLSDKTLQIHGGRAHGICIGDEFSICPPFTERDGPIQDHVSGRVIGTANIITSARSRLYCPNWMVCSSPHESRTSKVCHRGPQQSPMPVSMD